MITPDYLKKGDTVAIVAPARKISMEELKPSKEILEKWGLKVLLGPRLFNAFHQFSGTDEERAADFQEMLDNAEVKAIFCARGGYGSVRIIDKLDFNNFVENPKWIVGFSDITVFHSHIHSHFGIETIHAPMPLTMPSSTPASLKSLKDALFGNNLAYKIAVSGPYRKGQAKGILCGGNISILANLCATPSDLHTDRKILFVEDLDEYLYHFDRMMMQMKRSGKINKLAGFFCGAITDMNDNSIPFGFDAEEIISRMMNDTDYPYMTHFPAGHINNNYALIFGRECEISITDNEASFIFSEKKGHKIIKNWIKSIVRSFLTVGALFAILYLLYYLLFLIIR